VSDDDQDLYRVDDLLYSGDRIRALQALQQATGSSLQQAIDAIGPRFEMLVETNPERFTVPLTDYWTNFYT